MPPNQVDRDIPSHATGAAAELVAKRHKPQDLKLYAGWFCPYVQRTWLVLEELGIPYQYIEINPYHKDPSFLAVNPRGLVPALGVPTPVSSSSTSPQNELKPLYESLVLCDYLDSAYTTASTTTTTTTTSSTPLPASLYPSSPYAKARMNIWIDWISKKICPAFYRLLQHDSQSAYTLASARSHLADVLLEWIREADPTGPFWAGAELSMIDVVLAPWNERWFVIEHYKAGGAGIPYVSNYGRRDVRDAEVSAAAFAEENSASSSGEDDESATQRRRLWLRWLRWSRAMSDRATVKATLSDRDMLLRNYARYADNSTGSEVGQATQEGKALP